MTLNLYLFWVKRFRDSSESILYELKRRYILRHLKINISYPLIRSRSCSYQGVTNVIVFWEILRMISFGSLTKRFFICTFVCDPLQLKPCHLSIINDANPLLVPDKNSFLFCMNYYLIFWDVLFWSAHLDIVEKSIWKIYSEEKQWREKEFIKKL